MQALVTESPSHKKAAEDNVKNTDARIECATPLNHSRRRRGNLDIPVNKLDDRLRICLAASATRQAFREVNGALSAQSLAARLATADCFFVLMVETTHDVCSGLTTKN